MDTTDNATDPLTNWTDMTIITNNATLTNSTTINTVPDNTKYYVGAWYGVMSFAGLSLVVSVLVTIFKTKRKDMLPFYMFLTSLCVADAAMFSLYLFYVVPCVVTDSQAYGLVDGFSVMGFVESWVFLAIVSNSFLISINRFFCVCFARIHDQLFTRRSSICLIFCTWLFAITINSLNIVATCVTTFNEKKFTFSTICTKIPGALSIGSFAIYFMVYGLAIFYAFSLRKLWQHKSGLALASQQVAQNMTRKQINMFLQAMCIWLSLLSNAVGFRIYPFILTGFPAAMMATVLVVCPSYVTPISILVFSSEMRQGLKNIFHESLTSTTSVQQVSGFHV